MIGVHPARIRPQDRVQTPSDKTPSAQTRTYAAPIGGWVSNANMAVQDVQTAVVLENFWPTATGVVPRGGSKRRVTIPNPVKTLFEYRAGLTGQFFVADENNIYAFSDTTLDGTALTATVSGQSNGEYSFLEMQTDGGSFLSLVNGEDYLRIFDGTNWQQVTDVSSPFAVTNVDTRALSHVWAYNNRQFFVEKGTMNAWYLGVNSVAGPAMKLPLAGVFRKGGSLLFGATWSSDSGEDMNDRCVFVTDQGEFALYNGDPASAEMWSFDGVYDLGAPLGPRAIMSVGGDLIVATKAGLVPLSAALQKDVSQLKLAALSRAIDPDWRHEVLLTGQSDGWRVEKWTSRNMALVVPPLAQTDCAYSFLVNLETGAWARFTGWRVNDLHLLGEALHFGTEDGVVYQCDVGGTDDGDLIPCRMCLAFDQLNGGSAFKVAHLVRGTFRHTVPFGAQFSVGTNYLPVFPAAPNSVLASEGVEASWDAATWDQCYWASELTDWQISEKWESVSGHGHALAVQMQLTSGAPYKAVCELVSIDLTYSSGAVVA